MFTVRVTHSRPYYLTTITGRLNGSVLILPYETWPINSLKPLTCTPTAETRQS